MYNDMPGTVDPDSAFGGGGGGGGGFIPPPPGATQGGQPYSPFPGAGQPNPGWSSAPAAPWTGKDSSWPAAPPAPPQSAPYGQQASYPPYSPYYAPTPCNASTPGASWDAATPAYSWGGPATPASAGAAAQNSPYVYSHQQAPDAAFGQPSPWSNGGAALVGETGAGYPVVGSSSPRKGLLGRSNSQRKTPAQLEYHGGAFDLQRTASQGPPAFGYSGAIPMRRTASVGAAHRSRKTSMSLQPFSAEEQMKSEVYGPNNLARRPLDWRRDFMTLAFAAKLPGYKIRSEVKEFNDPITRTAHELLAYKNRQEPVFVDLRFPPQQTLDFPLLDRRYNQVDFDQLATQPAAQDMRLYHDNLPWYIDIVQRRPNGITVFDVIWELYTQLSMPIHGRHWFNDVLTPTHHEKMEREWSTRIERNAEGYRGVTRVDFLHGKTIFLGLKRGSRGLWEIKTAKWDEVQGYSP